jgi:heme A synthase
MKLVIRTVVFHTICILLFASIYLYLSDHFQSEKEEKNKKYTTFTDFLLLSTTIQAGVGISDLFPTSFFSKVAVIVQQFTMILTHVITLYIFTL